MIVHAHMLCKHLNAGTHLPIKRSGNKSPTKIEGRHLQRGILFIQPRPFCWGRRAEAELAESECWSCRALTPTPLLIRVDKSLVKNGHISSSVTTGSSGIGIGTCCLIHNNTAMQLAEACSCTQSNAIMMLGNSYIDLIVTANFVDSSKNSSEYIDI
jgi:hypothetical protein